MRVDRGGGREGKCSSLRATKKSAAELVKKLVKGQIGNDDGTETTAPPPPILIIDSEVASDPMRHVDSGAQMLNRQFDNSQLQTLRRARQAGVEAIVAYTTDFEKLEVLVALAKENRGFIYCSVGIHTDMIKRSNDKFPPQRLEALRAAALRPEVVSFFAGLDFSRDVGLRYAQLRSLEQQLEIAREVGLPVVLYQVAALSDLIEKIELHFTACDSPSASSRVALYNFSGSITDLSGLKNLSQPIFVSLSGRLVTDLGEKGVEFRSELKAALPIDRVLVCTDSPHSTPLNIEDTFVREGKNEPSNLPYIVKALSEAYSLDEKEVAEIVRANSYRFFGLHSQVVVEEALLLTTVRKAGQEEENAKAKNQPELVESGDVKTGMKVETNQDEGVKASVAEKKQQVLEEAPLMSRKAVNSYLKEGGGSEARVTYSCRGCRSILFTDADILPHQGGGMRADFVSGKVGKRGKEDGRCSLYFVRMDLPWMADLKEEEGRLDCPSCQAKIGRYENAEPLACSCGVEISPPSRGLLKARLDLIDRSINLEKAMEANLKLYNEESEEYVDGSSDDEGGGKKKKKKQAKGRGNKSNFSNYRNKSDLQPKKAKDKEED